MAEPDGAGEPLYAEARAMLSSPGSAALRRQYSLEGQATDVSWLTDDVLCTRIRRELRRTSNDPPLAAVRVGNLILVHARPHSARYLFDPSGKLLAILDVVG